MKKQQKKAVIDGKIQFGRYDNAFSENNLYETDKPWGILSKYIKNLKLKEWQAFQIGNERFFILIALYNAKFTGVVQFLIYDRQQKKEYFYKKNVIPTKLKIPNTLNNSLAEYKSKKLSIKVEYTDSRLQINVFAKNYRNLPDFNFIVKANMTKKKPQIVCIPFEKNAGMYSQKSALRADGKLTINNNNFTFLPENSFINIDDHKGYYPNPMIYDWCTGAITNKENFTVFNLTDNQSINPNMFNENCIWVNDDIFYLPPVEFFREQGVDYEWKIKDKEGLVDLRFYPVVKNIFKLNLLIIKSDYHGPFGYYKGFIKTPSGDKIILDDCFGMGEKKHIKG